MSAIMAKKKTTKSGQKRPGKNLNIYIPADLRDALSGYIRGVRPKTTATAVAQMALEEFLAKQGVWPPRPAE